VSIDNFQIKPAGIVTCAEQIDELFEAEQLFRKTVKPLCQLFLRLGSVKGPTICGSGFCRLSQGVEDVVQSWR